MKTNVVVNRIIFKNFKALKHFSIGLSSMNILVGPNNTGKSTILHAFRVLEAGMRRANSKKAELVDGPEALTYGHVVPTDDLPISLENVHTNYDESIPTTVDFQLSNRQQLTLYFPPTGGCNLIPSNTGRANGIPSIFRKSFPIKVGFVPVLGPLEHEEQWVIERTVKRNLSTHRASRNFRNYWYYFPEKFDDFSNLVSESWKGMTIELPELNVDYNYLVMFCNEERFPRELYWAGFGFQIWCQLLTHIVRNEDATLLVVDEPDIYLHPDMQRQILGILRGINSDILLATHSTEIIAEAAPSEILFIDKTKQSAIRLKNIDQVQDALDHLGSSQNITLTQLARTRRVLFVEGNDFKILSRFARQLERIDIANQADFTVVSTGGFSQWEKIKSLTWGFEKTLGQSIVMGAIFDRDYFSNEEITEIKKELDENLDFAHIHERKELENYLLVPIVLDRAIKRKIGKTKAQKIPNAASILEQISTAMHTEILSQYTFARTEYFRKNKSPIHPTTITDETIRIFENKWENIETRMEIVPGKKIFRAFNRHLQDEFGFNLTDMFVIRQFNKDEVPSDLNRLFRQLEIFKKRKAAK